MEIDIMKNKKDKMARQSKLQRVTWQIGEAVLSNVQNNRICNLSPSFSSSYKGYIGIYPQDKLFIGKCSPSNIATSIQVTDLQ